MVQGEDCVGVGYACATESCLADTHKIADIEMAFAIPPIGHQWTVLAGAVVHAGGPIGLERGGAGHPVVAKEDRLGVVVGRAPVVVDRDGRQLLAGLNPGIKASSR